MKMIFVVVTQTINGKNYAFADTIKTGETSPPILLAMVLISVICAKAENKLKKSLMHGTNHTRKTAPPFLRR